jgi:hypothetical protein
MLIPGSHPISEMDILVVAYRRFDNLEEILKICLSQGAQNIYVSIDGCAAHASSEAQLSNSKTKALATKLEAQFPDRLKIGIHDSNLGSSVNMLCALDWAFKYSKNLIVLEDDCIPSELFFEFANSGFEYMKSNSDTWAICGTQHNSTIENDDWYLSEYFQVWGWATTRERWLDMKSTIFGFGTRTVADSKKSINLSVAERSYWLAGSRRSLNGYVDAWDIPITAYMRLNGKSALVPTKNLVSNVGNDEAALHVKNSKWTREAEIKFVLGSPPPKVSPSLDEWTKRYFYKIRWLHTFSTRAHYFIDIFKKPRLLPLVERVRSYGFEV